MEESASTPNILPSVIAMTFESAIHRAAVLIKSLSKDQARKLLCQLEPDELQKVFHRMRSLGEISPQQKQVAIQSFVSATENHTSNVPPRLQDAKRSLPFEHLRDSSATLVFDLLKDEHPKDVAITLTYLPARLAADTLSYFDPNARLIVLRRLCRLQSVDLTKVNTLSKQMESKLSRAIDLKVDQELGMDVATRLLSCTDPFTRSKILDELDQHDPKLSQEIQQQVLCFHDLLSWDDKQIQKVLPWIDTSLWAPAIKTVGQALQRKILLCFAEKPRTLLQRELSMLDSIDGIVAEHARNEIVRAIVSLADEGKLRLPDIRKDEAA